jgi:hypothetical protein
MRLCDAHRVEIAFGVKLGELDQHSSGEVHGGLHLQAQQLALAELSVRLEHLLDHVDGGVLTTAAVNDEGAWETRCQP